jgi:hypothetical protein
MTARSRSPENRGLNIFREYVDGVVEGLVEYFKQHL